ncbi:lysophospholipid acyltransferase LPCAT4 isoform X2 [Erythrolamprus reginae]|uniref:lysophospholipid acyltransferase LPCAT4 isoform X2 n=1 Tax=Erythrolamprus reginae TaxID=121349 RepID=UPI00396C706D
MCWGLFWPQSESRWPLWSSSLSGPSPCSKWWDCLRKPCKNLVPDGEISHGSVYWLSRLMFFLLGFMRIRVRGQRASRLEAPILVAAPHSTFFDPIILLPCDLPKVVSRTENLHVPVIGALLRFNQAILVSRHDPASRKKVVEEVKKRATSRGKWPQVLFYPEGTCSNKKALLKFKPGAFISGVPIQPVLIRYPNSVDSTTWAWRGPGVLKVIWLTASQPCTTVEVEFLPVYQPSPEEAVNPALYANNVQKVMAKALGIPATDCEFVGNLPVTVVGRLRVALEPRIWELGKAIQKARLTEGIKCDLDALPLGTSGQVGPNELAHWLGLSCPKAVEKICIYFQQDSNGNMDAREVTLALEALRKEHDPQQLTLRAFELFSEVEAKTGTSCLHQDGFCAILRLLLGTPVVDGTELYGRLCTEGHSQDGLNLGQFQDFCHHHPDYARLFSTYLRPPPACALPKPAEASTYANGVSAISPKSKDD